MNTKSIAPCGIICDICYGFVREKNKCTGCNILGNKSKYCTVCKIKTCPEKEGETNQLCYKCSKFPCKRIKDLDKRYRTKYGESIIQNLLDIKTMGIRKFVQRESEKWKCQGCGQLLCVHKRTCPNCGKINHLFPPDSPIK